jgi:hypothetical protein
MNIEYLPEVIAAAVDANQCDWLLPEQGKPLKSIT